MAKTVTAATALLGRLKAIGVDYVFANSGTDFPPIIEGLAEAAAGGIAVPQAIAVPHEHAAMGMAHGYYLATGRPQAVIAHTNVGLANCAIGAINAHVEHVPILLFSGRTPTVEQGRFGARTVPIGWGQEMRDQTALVREATKWDYELRFPEQAPAIVDRAYAIATSSPRGPVYVSLPREVLCEPCPADGLDQAPSMTAAVVEPGRAAIARLAALIAAARNPVIFAQHGAGDEAGFAALSRLAADWAIPVCQYWALQLAIPTDHAMAAGDDPAPLLARADLILCLDTLAPWSPGAHGPAPGCVVAHMGQDPLSIRSPVRNFRADLAVACDLGPGLVALAAALAGHAARDAGSIAARRQRIAAENGAARRRVLERAAPDAQAGLTKAQVGLVLSRALEGRQASVLSELGCPLAPMRLDHPRAWYQEPHAGGLGWSFPAALGMQLADRARLVVATLGDGSYMFANPVACHQIAEALELPVLLLVLNNAGWGAVRHSVLGLYPKGHAARANRMPLTDLSPSPDFTKVAAASRAWAAHVENAADLRARLDEALAHVARRAGPALLDIRIRD